MKIFLIKIVLLIIAILLVALGFELLIDNKLKQGNIYYFQGDWHDLKNHNADVVLVGNSRIWVQMDPVLIERNTGMKVDIIAMDGQGCHMVWLKFKEYLKGNKPPKKVFLLFDSYFSTGPGNLHGFSRIQQYFFYDRIDLRSLSNHDGYTWLYHYLPLAAIEHCLLFKVLTNDTLDYSESYEAIKGFKREPIGFEGDWNNPQVQTLETNSISSYIDSFYFYCAKNNIELYSIYPPQTYQSFRKFSGMEEIIAYHNALNVALNKSYKFLNYNSVKYSDSALYRNHTHLNTRGVDTFMKQFLSDTTVKW